MQTERVTAISRALRRRRALGLLAGAALLGPGGLAARAREMQATAPAESAAGGSPPAARSDGDGTLVVGCWGGSFARALHALVDPQLQQNAGVGVRQVVSDERSRVARLLVPSASGDAAAFDVAMLSDLDAYRLSLRQLFLPVTTTGVADLPKVTPGLRVPYGIPVGQTALCIGFNTRRLASGPRSFAALLRLAHKGRVGFSAELAIHNLAAAAVTEHGRPSLKAAKAIFLDLKRSGVLRVYPNNEALGTALAAGEIDAAPIWRSRAYAWEREGRDVSDTYPDEGAIPFVVVAAVPQASHRARHAMQYLETMLHAETQLGLATQLGLLPVVGGVQLPAALSRRIGFTEVQRARLRPISLAATAQGGVALRQFWDHELS